MRRSCQKDPSLSGKTLLGKGRGDRWTNRLTFNKVNHASLRWTHDDPLFDASLFVVVVVLPRFLALGTLCKVA